MPLRRTSWGDLPLPAAGFFDPCFSRKWVHHLGSSGKYDALVYAEAMLEAEQGFYPMGSDVPGVLGPLKIRHARDEIDLDRLGHGYYLLPWDVGPDRLTFRHCTARGVLVVEKWSVAHHLSERRFARRTSLLVVCADGMPRYNTRRFLHRLSRELHLPVYLLTDNDPWGYFMLSVLRRGAILPHAQCPEARVGEVRYLGLRGGDYESLPVTNPRNLMLRWRRPFAAELGCLRHYRCFSGARWRQELDRFEAQRAVLELEAVTGPAGPDWFVEFLAARIEKEDWLA